MATSTTPGLLSPRPKRADARRNYDKLIEAARAAFTEHGSDASLEEIARRADLGIGTLYRHFPTRHALLQAVYVEEVEALAASASDFADLPSWDALVAWLRRFVAYALAKRALSDELLATLGADSDVFRKCHLAIWQAGEPLLQRAQEDGMVRADTDFGEVVRMVSGVSMIKTADAEQLDRILLMALDGVRYNAPAARAAQTDG
jgi:AcrR family transcriptional regulator